MSFAIVCIAMLMALGVIAAVANHFQDGSDEPVTEGHDCSSCSAVVSGECKIGCLLEEKKRRQGNLSEEKKKASRQ